MQNGSSDAGQQAVRALRHELRDADDQKVKRITAVLDEIADPTVNQSILDPFRDRLAVLKPVRPIRFSRVLFVPLDPVIVPARDWKPGDPSVPRTALASMCRVVRAQLAAEAGVIDKIIAGRKADTTQAITLAGERLWPQAAEILAVAPAPADWVDTGLRPAVYQPLAVAIAAVLRRGSQLRCLLRDGEVGALEADDGAIRDLLHNITSEPAEGQAMITRLILLQSPHAAPAVRRFMSSSRDLATRTMLQQAMAGGVEHALAKLESDAGFAKDIARVALADAGVEVRRITTLLAEIEEENGAAANRPRLRAIREKLNQACQTRFADGLREGVVTPLAEAAGLMDGAGQIQLENCTRDLRALEIIARRVGSPAHYDRLLAQASDAVLAAAASGTLSPVRKIRLIEILAGPEAAEALYRQETATR